jgi:hypothetical protein
MLILLLAYPDSWFLYLLFYFAPMIPAILNIEAQIGSLYPKSIKMIKYLTKIMQLYFAVGVILHYLIFGFDPLTPVLLGILYGILLFLLFSRNQKEARIKN